MGTDSEKSENPGEVKTSIRARFLVKVLFTLLGLFITLSFAQSTFDMTNYINDHPAFPIQNLKELIPAFFIIFYFVPQLLNKERARIAGSLIMIIIYVALVTTVINSFMYPTEVDKERFNAVVGYYLLSVVLVSGVFSLDENIKGYLTKLVDKIL